MSNSESSDSVVTAGTLLRKAREASGLHIAALAVSMKVPVKKLEALESDRLDLLPDAVFARALANSMCRALKIDPAPIMEKLPGTKKVSLSVESRAANQPFDKSTYSASGSASLKLGKPVVFVVLTLLVGVALILFVPPTDDVKTQEDAVEGTVTQPVEELIIPIPAPVLQSVTPAPAASVPLEAASSPATTLPATPSPVTPTPVAPAPVVKPVVPAAPVSQASAPQLSATVPNAVQPTPVPKQETVSAPSAVSSNHVVVFKVRGPSWVEVTDARGVVQLRRNLNEGEQAGAAGTLPMVVVVGRADVTDVAVRGKPFDVSKLAVGNVARFEVK